MEQTPECQSKSDNDEELYFDGADLVVGGQSEMWIHKIGHWVGPSEMFS